MLTRFMPGGTFDFVSGDIYGVDRRPDGTYGPPPRLSAGAAKA